jgi:methionyl-tRNA formyltransferase
MADQIILLTGEVEAPYLIRILAEKAPDIEVFHADNSDILNEICRGTGATGRRRLIAYCTSIIVPPDVLQAMDGPSYNFHPGPPAYPGVHSASFAIFDRATQFGVTAHIMADTADSGEIVAVASFDVAADINCRNLESRAYVNLFELFQHLAPNLVDLSTSLTTETTAWGAHKFTQAEFSALANITDSMGSEEIARRHRAVEI